MSCKFGHTDCTNTEQCYLCFNSSKYIPEKKKSQGLKKNLNKKSNRMGSTLETKTQQRLQSTVTSDKTMADMTPNSGAGNVKGDAQIRGLVKCMIENKTQEVVRAKGHTQFTIKREWLDKLAREAPDENMEFWWLTFSFKDTDNQLYTVIDDQQMQDMIATLVHDRRIAKEADRKVDLANKLRKMTEAKNTELEATIDRLKAELEYYKLLADYTQIKKLINKYEEEANEIYDEFMHGDSSARQEAYNNVIDDLKKIINKEGDDV